MNIYWVVFLKYFLIFYYLRVGFRILSLACLGVFFFLSFLMAANVGRMLS